MSSVCISGTIKTVSNIFYKWKERIKVGIYLGRSPLNEINLALLIYRVTGHVSPLFHVSFCQGFHTVKQDDFDSRWAVKSEFMNQIGQIVKNKLLG